MTYKSSDVRGNGAITAKNGKARSAFNEKPKSKRVETKGKSERPLKSKCAKRNGTNHNYADSNKVTRNSCKQQEGKACNENISAFDDTFSLEEDDTSPNKDFKFKEPITEVSEAKSSCERSITYRPIHTSTSLKIHLDDMFANGLQKESMMSVSDDDDNLTSGTCVSASPLSSRRSSTLSSSTYTSSGTMELGCQIKHNYWNQSRQVNGDGIAVDNRSVGRLNITLLQLENSYEKKLQTLTKELTSICRKEKGGAAITPNSISESELSWPLVTNCCGDTPIDRRSL